MLVLSETIWPTTVHRRPQRRKGNKTHLAVDTPGHLLALHITPADQQNREQIEQLSRDVQEATGQRVCRAYVETDGREVVKPPETKRRFVLLPRRWVVERSFGRMARFRGLSKDYERLPQIQANLHFAAFAILILARF